MAVTAKRPRSSSVVIIQLYIITNAYIHPIPTVYLSIGNNLLMRNNIPILVVFERCRTEEVPVVFILNLRFQKDKPVPTIAANTPQRTKALSKQEKHLTIRPTLETQHLGLIRYFSFPLHSPCDATELNPFRFGLMQKICLCLKARISESLELKMRPSHRLRNQAIAACSTRPASPRGKTPARPKVAYPHATCTWDPLQSRQQETNHLW